MKKILIVEDSIELANTIKTVLQDYYSIDISNSIKTAKKLLIKKDFDLALLDIMFPRESEDGLKLCKHIRNNNPTTKVIMLTGKNAINYKIGAFNKGADDYLCKPFSMLELKARIKAVLKRNEISSNDILESQHLRLDIDARKAYREDSTINLSSKEYDILKYLMENKGKAISRESIMNKIWYNKDVYSNTIDVHINNLRQKIDNGYETKAIETVYGIGYKII